MKLSLPESLEASFGGVQRWEKITNRFLVTVLVIAFVSGCSGPGSTASPSPTITPRATFTAASVQPSAAPTMFPTEAFSALSDDPIPPDVAAMFEAALA